MLRLFHLHSQKVTGVSPQLIVPSSGSLPALSVRYRILLTAWITKAVYPSLVGSRQQ